MKQEHRSVKEQLISAHVKLSVATMKEESAARMCDGSDKASARFDAAQRARQQAVAEETALRNRLRQSDE